MEKEDARKQSCEVLRERRKQVICRYPKGTPAMKFVEHSGLSWYAVNKAITAYLAVGTTGLKPAVRGKKPGTGRSLNKEQEAQIHQLICDKCLATVLNSTRKSPDYRVTKPISPGA